MRSILPKLLAISLTATSPDARAQVGSSLVERLTGQGRLPSLPAAGEASIAPEVRALLDRPLTPDDAYRVAIANNRALRASLRGLGIQDARLVTAGTLPNPEFEFDLRRPTDDDPLQKDVFLGFDLTRAILTGYRSDVARAAIDAERLRVAGELTELGYRVRSAFYAAQAAEQSLVVTTRSLDALAAARDAARALYDAGNIPELDLASQEAAYEEARLALAARELERVERLETLRSLLGLHGPEAAVRLAGTLPPVPGKLPDPGALESRIVSASLDLKELRARLAVASARTRAESAQGWIPDVSIDAHAEQDGTRWEVGGGFRIALPVFDRRQGPLAEAETEFDVLRDREEAVATDLRSAARTARARLESAHARARHYLERVVPARRRVLEASLRQYNAMQIGIFPLLAAHRLALEADIGQVGALRDFWTASAGLDALMSGRRVDASLSSTTDLAPAAPAESGGH